MKVLEQQWLFKRVLNNWRESKKVIILYYLPFSCGKFLSNILSYNLNFIPQLSTQNDIKSYTDIKIKHDAIISTIPSQEHLKEWRKYELGCVQFYGFNLQLPDNIGEKVRKCKPIIKDLILRDTHFTFIVAHNQEMLKFGKLMFPNSKILRLINDKLVNELSKKIKFNNERHINYAALPNLNYPDTFDFDIFTMFNKEIFFQNVYNFMKWLQIDNCDIDNNVNLYYTKYMSLYKA